MKRRQNVQTIFFVIFILLGGVFHIIESTLTVPQSTPFFCAVFIIYTGLILFWLQSVRARLLPSRSRTYMTSAAWLMLFYLFVKAVKYRIAFAPLFERLFWYAYYIPLLIIPTLFLMSCISFVSREHGKVRERLLLIPAVLIALGVMTNDLHFLTFAPKVALSEFSGDRSTYAYGFMFYAAYAWIGLTIAVSVALLIVASRKFKSWKKSIYPFIFLALIPILTVLFDILHSIDPSIPRMFETPEINIFCMLGVFEACVRTRLMPYNENYVGFWGSMEIPAVITDLSFTPQYKTASPIAADADKLKRSLSEPVYQAEDIRLHGQAISAGYAFWATDERELRRMNDKLIDMNETLAEENTLIEAENKQRQEIARSDFQNRIYGQIAEELYPTYQKIEKLLNSMTPKTPDYGEKLGHICVLNAYVKRATNLMLLAADNTAVDCKELYFALEESARYLSYVGVKASATAQAKKPISSDKVFAIYKTFEQITETLLPEITLLMVALTDSGLRITANAEAIPKLPDTQLPCTALHSEGILYLTVNAKGGDEQ